MNILLIDKNKKGEIIMIKYLLDCSIVILMSMIGFLLLYKKYDMKKNKIVLKIICIIILIGVKFLITFLQIPPLNLLSSYILIVLIMELMYKCKISLILIYSAVSIIISFTAEVFSTLVGSIIYKDTIDSIINGSTIIIIQKHIWSWIFIIVFNYIFSKFIRPNKDYKIKWHELVFYIILIVFEVGIFFYVSIVIQNNSNGLILLFMVVGFLVLDLYIMYIFNMIFRSREAESQIALMQQQEKLQLQMYQKLQSKYSESCSVVHDINKHINSLHKLIEKESDNQRAEQYLSDLKHTAERLRPTIRNQNVMLEIILNTVSERYKKSNIILDLEVEDFLIDFISDMDITTIFSNLLDNAEEACLELLEEERKVCMILKQRTNLILLQIKNPYANIKNINEKFYSTKKGHSGIGLSNIKKSVKKYNGTMSVQTENNEFQVLITLPLNKKEKLL